MNNRSIRYKSRAWKGVIKSVSCNHHSANCICHTLKGIVLAQSSRKKDDHILCHDFHSPLEVRTNIDTIPIMLLCKGTCEFFIGSGVFHTHEAIECFKTPVFRVSKVIEDDHDQCCVELELLQPQGKNGGIPSCHDHDVCSFFSDKKIEKFIRTGVCIVVDVGCFCGIECLPPVKAHCETPVSCPPKTTTPHHREEKIIKEEICGNFGPGKQIVWEAISVDNIHGTFQIFNSANSTSPVEGFVDGSNPVIFPAVPPGSTLSRSTTFPKSFTIEAPTGSSGKYCIIFTKIISMNQPCKDWE